ncbi:MAG TPA: efflux RND transporter periplasmic adaptor subunit [Candidatus Saccharimonadales bacterium]|nr:efflux RND transporter periplasmic adaptor subunit [Candidatus Saccharimonadales bacterium]
MPPIPVSVTPAIQQDIPVYGDWVATLDGYVNAQIQPQVSGYLVKQLYKEGSAVHRGDVLFEVDARPFVASLDQAKAQQAQAQAKLSLTEVNVKRDTPLAKERAISQSQLDTELAFELEAKAGVQAAQAAVEQAELNLNFTKVRSLVDGVAGIATTQIGNLVAPNTVLTTVSMVDPIKVYFPISEQEYLKLADKLKKESSTKHSMGLELTLADGTTYPQKGTVAFTDRHVDPQTGTIRLVGAFSNPGGFLRPGQFGRVRALIGTRAAAVLIPQRAVLEVQGAHLVAVVTPGNKISMRPIKVGDRFGSMWVVDEGVKAGDQVVTEGTIRVRDGAVVNPTADTRKTEGKQ